MENFNELIKKYAERGKRTNISIGLRPSGVIHLGNMATLGLAGVLGERIGSHLSKVQVTICDLDMPSSIEWSVKENQYMKYFRDIPGKDSRYTLLDESMEKIRNYTLGLESPSFHHALLLLAGLPA